MVSRNWLSTQEVCVLRDKGKGVVLVDFDKIETMFRFDFGHGVRSRIRMFVRGAIILET